MLNSRRWLISSDQGFRPLRSHLVGITEYYQFAFSLKYHSERDCHILRQKARIAAHSHLACFVFTQVRRLPLAKTYTVAETIYRSGGIELPKMCARSLFHCGYRLARL